MSYISELREGVETQEEKISLSTDRNGYSVNGFLKLEECNCYGQFSILASLMSIISSIFNVLEESGYADGS